MLPEGADQTDFSRYPDVPTANPFNVVDKTFFVYLQENLLTHSSSLKDTTLRPSTDSAGKRIH